MIPTNRAKLILLKMMSLNQPRPNVGKREKILKAEMFKSEIKYWQKYNIHQSKYEKKSKVSFFF